MPINVTCDHCGQSLQVLEEHSGKQVRCPKCYQVFVAKQGVAPAVEAAAPAPVPPGGEPVSVSSPSPSFGGPQAKFCPHCGVGLPANAGFCPGCGKPPSAPPAGQVFSPAFAPQGGVPAPYMAPPQNNGLAVASLVLGIASWACLGPLCGIPAIICGHMARGQIRNSNGTQTGETLALVGLVIAYVNLLGWCGYFGLFAMMGMPHKSFP